MLLCDRTSGLLTAYDQNSLVGVAEIHEGHAGYVEAQGQNMAVH